jgi:phosphate butyryltransferase
MVYKSLQQLEELVKNKPVRRLAVAAADDKTVLLSIKSAYEANYIHPILVGNSAKIEHIAAEIGLNLQNVEIVHAASADEASRFAVSLIRSEKADVLMKGMVPTAIILRAVVDKENGMIKGNEILSHISISEISCYHKLLALTDGAMNISPDFNQKIQILNNAVNVLRNLGYEKPKVAVLAPLETVNMKIESSVHGAVMSVMNKRKQIKNCIVDGPLALDNAISAEASKHKAIESEVAGDADILLVSDLNMGNGLYKAFNFLANAQTAAIITGGCAPIVLTSRADSEQNKHMSIVLACLMVK